MSFQTPKRRKVERTLSYSMAPSSMSTTVGNATKGGSYKRGKYNKSSNKLANFVKAVIRNDAEKKEALTGLTNTLTATQSAVTLVSGIAQGTTGITRVGLEVTHAYLEVTLTIYNQVTSVGAIPIGGDAGFWALVLDRQPNGAAPTFAQIFDDSVGGQSGNDFRITTTNQDRFKILKREEWSIGCAGALSAGAGATYSGAAPYHCKEFIDMSKAKGFDSKANFSGSGSSIASIDSGAIFFCIAGSLCDADNNTVYVGQVKYRFTDL